MNNAKYIEIVGLPGSGKTTVAKLLVEELKESGIESYRRLPLNINIAYKIKILFCVLFIFIRFPIVWSILFAKISSKYKKVKSSKKVVKNIKARLLIELVIVQKFFLKKESIVFNDEGIVGRLVVLSILTNFTEKNLLKVLEKFFGSDLGLIYLNTPIDLAINRTFERKTFLPFFHEMNKFSREEFYKLNTDVYKRIFDSYGHTKNTIFNKGSKEELQKELDGLLEKIL